MYTACVPLIKNHPKNKTQNVNCPLNASQVTRLCDLSNDANSVTSVSWSERGNQVAVGTHHGYVTVWDVAVNKQVSQLR